MTVGERIKAIRKKNNMTQEELAHKCGYKCKSSINKIELSRDLPLNKVALVADALGVSPSYLMGWLDDDNAFTREDAELDAKLASASISDKKLMLKFVNLPKKDKKTISNMIDYLSASK